jgi:hypothetical protein
MPCSKRMSLSAMLSTAIDSHHSLPCGALLSHAQYTRAGSCLKLSLSSGLGGPITQMSRFGTRRGHTWVAVMKKRTSSSRWCALPPRSCLSPLLLVRSVQHVASMHACSACSSAWCVFVTSVQGCQVLHCICAPASAPRIASCARNAEVYAHAYSSRTSGARATTSRRATRSCSKRSRAARARATAAPRAASSISRCPPPRTVKSSAT